MEEAPETREITRRIHFAHGCITSFTLACSVLPYDFIKIVNLIGENYGVILGFISGLQYWMPPIRMEMISKSVKPLGLFKAMDCTVFSAVAWTVGMDWPFDRFRSLRGLKVACSYGPSSQ